MRFYSSKRAVGEFLKSFGPWAPVAFIAVQASGNEVLVQAVDQLSASGNSLHPAGNVTARGVSSKLLPS